MKLTRSFIITNVLLMIFVCPPAFPEDYAYVLKFQNSGADLLVKFDLQNNLISEEVKLPRNKAFNNFVVDENGGCYISNYRSGGDYYRDIYHYDNNKRKIERFVKLNKMFGPKTLFLIGNELIVEITGNDRTRLHSGVIFVDRATRKITGRVFFREDDPYYVQANVNRMFYDGGDNIFISSFDMLNDDDPKMLMEHLYTGDIYVIDVKKRELSKVINIDKQYKFLDGLCVVGDKIYIAPCAKGKRTKGGDIPVNDEIIIYSLKTQKMIKTIKVSPHPCGLTYDRSVGKIYVQHRIDKELRDTVEIIDAGSDKVIGKLAVPGQLMFSLVKPGTLFISVGSIDIPSARYEPKLLIIDTKTDKVVKEYYGRYTGISINKTN